MHVRPYVSLGQIKLRDRRSCATHNYHDPLISGFLKGQASSLGPIHDQYTTGLSNLLDIHAPLKVVPKTGQVVNKRNQGSKSFQTPPRADLETYKI